MTSRPNPNHQPVSPDAIDAYWAAFDAHNSGLLDTETYMAAFEGMHDFVPTNARDFVRKFVAAYEQGGVPSQERHDQLLTQAKAVLAEPAGSDDVPLRGAWQLAQQAARFARSAMERYREEITLPTISAMEAGAATYEDVFQAETGWEPYTSNSSHAVTALVMTPAPDFASVITKIDLGIAEGVFDGSEESVRMIQALADDIRRLSGEC